MARVISVVERRPFIAPMHPETRRFIFPEASSYRVEGLSVWGEESSPVQLYIAGSPVFPAPLPAAVFSSAMSFEEMGNLPLRMLPKVKLAIQWRDMPGIIPVVGGGFAVWLKGDVEQAVLWGQAIKEQHN